MICQFLFVNSLEFWEEMMLQQELLARLAFFPIDFVQVVLNLQYSFLLRYENRQNHWFKDSGLQAEPPAMALFLHISINALKATLSSSPSNAFLKPFQRSISDCKAIRNEGTVLPLCKVS
jgi:hypothetical protein